MEHPEQVDIDDQAPRLRVEAVGQVDTLDAGVVDEHVHSSLVGIDVGERRFDSGEVGDVRLQVARPLADLLGLSQVDGHATRSLVEERTDDGVADAPGATRHNHHLVRERLGHGVLAPLRLLRCNRFR